MYALYANNTIQNHDRLSHYLGQRPNKDFGRSPPAAFLRASLSRYGRGYDIGGLFSSHFDKKPAPLGIGWALHRQGDNLESRRALKRRARTRHSVHGQSVHDSSAAKNGFNIRPSGSISFIRAEKSSHRVP